MRLAIALRADLALCVCHAGCASISGPPAARCCVPAACHALGSGPANLQVERLPNVEQRKRELEDGEQIINLDSFREEVFPSMAPARDN